MSQLENVHLPSDGGSQPDRPRVALVGVSGYARIHWEILRALHLEGRIRLQNVVVINPESEEETVNELRRLGIAIHPTVDDLFSIPRNSIDLCSIPTGIHLHASMTLQALRHGANVLVEKPLTARLADIPLLDETAHKQNRFIAVGFQDLYFPPNRWLKEQLLAGAIGNLTRIRGIGLWPRPISYYRRNEWAGMLQVGSDLVLDSPLNNGLAHFLNLALYWAGSTALETASASSVTAELYRAQKIESFDTAAVRLQTEEDVEITFVVSHSSAHNLEPVIVLEGDAGRAEWRHNMSIRLEPENGPVLKRPLGSYDEVRLSMYEHVLRRLQNANAFICGTAMATEHVRCINDMHRQARIHPIPDRWVRRLHDGEENEERLAVVDLDKWALEAFEGGLLLSETECPWASSASDVLYRSR